MCKHPWVLEGLTCCEPDIWPTDELSDQVFGRVVNIVPLLSIKVELAGRHALQDLIVVITKEGRVTAQKDVEHAAC